MDMRDITNFLPYRILTRYTEAKQLLEEGILPPPRFADIYPVYGCNHNCIGCDYTQLNSKPVMWSEQQFRQVMDELHDIGCEAVDACGGGEPTLNPHLYKMIDLWVEEYDNSFGLLTNGTRIQERLLDTVVDNVSYIRFSIEAATEEVFTKYKRPLSEDSGWNNVITNLKDTISLRDLIDSKLNIGYKFTIDKNNIQDIEEAFGLASELGVDSLQFKIIRNVESEISEEQKQEVKDLISYMSTGYPDLYVIANFDNYKLRGDCWLNPLWPTIDAYGDVWICCYYRHRMGSHKLGNMFDTPLEDIWYSREHLDKICDIDKSECLKYDCRFMKYNDMMYDVLANDLGQVRFL